MDNTFIYFETDYKRKPDNRLNKEVRKELNFSLLGILGFSYEEAKRYIKEDKKLFHKKKPEYQKNFEDRLKIILPKKYLIQNTKINPNSNFIGRYLASGLGI